MKQNNYYLIGITGGIGSGKSTVSSFLKDKGYIVIDADKIAKEVVEVNKPAYLKIVETFGNDILSQDKTINRKKLGKIIFTNESLRKKLNNITHPYIFEEIKCKVNELSSNNKLVFIDIPLLFEEIEEINKHNLNFNEIWLVYVDKETQVQRVMNRDLISKEEALIRINSQMSLEDKKKKSNRIIDNRGDLSILRENLEVVLKEVN